MPRLNMAPRQRAWIWLMFAFLTLVLTESARAHGGGELMVGLEPAGPYSVSVWMNPPAPRAAETLHFTVGVATQEDGAPMLDANVVVVLTPLERETAVITANATTEQSANKLFYETDTLPQQSGAYRADVAVEGPAGGGNVTFNFEVLAAGGPNWLLIGLLGLGLIVVWGLWRNRRAQTADATDAPPGRHPRAARRSRSN